MYIVLQLFHPFTAAPFFSYIGSKEYNQTLRTNLYIRTCFISLLFFNFLLSMEIFPDLEF